MELGEPKRKFSETFSAAEAMRAEFFPIPEDVMRAASAAYRGEDELAKQTNGAKLERIARAILAERERCARIAETYRNDNPWPTVYGAIAAAIRAPSASPASPDKP